MTNICVDILDTDCLRLRQIVFRYLQYLNRKISIKNIFKESFFSINIVNDRNIHGGLCTDKGIIVENDIHLIFHELTHIWIGNMVKFSVDSEWIKEGLIEYYSIKAHKDLYNHNSKQYCLFFKILYQKYDL